MESIDKRPSEGISHAETERGSTMLKKLETHSDADRLAQLGYQAELKRTFSLPSLIALCLCLMATWEATCAVVAQALAGGGAPCLFYNFVLTFICTVALALSMAEIASIYPTAGGQYHWVAALHPARGRRTMAWFTGWISVGGQLVLSASAAFAAALMIQGLIILNNPEYEATRWQGMLLYWAILCYSAAINIFGERILPTANLVAGGFHILGFAIIFIVLGVKSDKNSAGFVFTETYNQTGWSNSGIAWLTGLISSLYPFLGYDATCHLAEELPHASRNVPLAMIGAVVANGLMGLIFVVMLLFSTGPLEEILDTATGLPFIRIFLDATKSRIGTNLMVLFPLIIAITANVAGVTSTSRTLWAFARDDATPFSKYFSQISKSRDVPVRAIVLITGLMACLGLIYIGNTTAYNAILAMAVIGMYISYAVPIACMLFNGRPNVLAKSDYGWFKLPKWLGIAVNSISLVWWLLCLVFMTFPSLMPVTEVNMNYSSVVIVGWCAFGALYYAIWGRKKFVMPVVEASVMTGIGTS
ncbi:amino acid permease, partial [Sarocladium strictum]